MESASLFVAGETLDIRAAAAVVVSDAHRVDKPASVDWSNTLAPVLTALDSAIDSIRSL